MARAHWRSCTTWEAYDSAGTKVRTEVINGTSWKALGLNYEQRYTWRVRATASYLGTDGKAVDTYGPWSTFGSFITPREQGLPARQRIPIRCSTVKRSARSWARPLHSRRGPQPRFAGLLRSYQLQTASDRGRVLNAGDERPDPPRRRQDQADGDVGQTTTTSLRTIGGRPSRSAPTAHGLAPHHPQRSDRDRFGRTRLRSVQPHRYVLLRHGLARQHLLVLLSDRAAPRASRFTDRASIRAARRTDPRTHVVYLGGPGGRAGDDSGTVPNIIVRQVWASPSPRPRLD